MIYTANRSVVNESRYSHADLSKILYESEVNDMAIFESALACDFNEIRGLQEGTVLESELRSLNEFSVKEMLGSIKQAAEKVFEKVLEAIRNAIAFIGNYVFHDGKHIVKKYKEYVKKYPNYSFKGTAKWVKSDAAAKFPKLDLEKMKEGANSFKEDDTTLSANAITCDELGYIARVNINIDSTKTFIKFMMESAISETKITQAMIDEMCATLETGRDPIKDLKKDEKEVMKSFRSYMSDMKKAEKDVENGVKASTIKTISKAYQDIITTVAKLNITLAKEKLRLARRTLTAVMTDMSSKKSDIKVECAISDSIFETYCTYVPGESPITEGCEYEVQKIIDRACNY